MTAPCAQPLPPLTPSQVAALNANCDCIPLPRDAIDQHIAERWGAEPIGDLIKAKTNLFAGTAVFVAESDWQRMQAQITAIEAIFSLPAYQRAITQRAPDLPACQTPGLFMGYDFHLSATGPRLIEINTNAGGAMIALSAQTAAQFATQSSGCRPAWSATPERVEYAIIEMLLAEWRSGQSPRVANQSRPRAVAIVDTDPTEQYLYPDMLLIARLLAEHGIRCVIVDPRELTISRQQLLARGEPIDLVYNRLTDFYLVEPAQAVLGQAHRQRLAVVSPAPEHHAYYADKRNLALLANAPLAEWGASAAQIQALAGLPATTTVTAATAAELWTNRKDLFFKPHAGYGSRAVYRGSKLTRKVWQRVQDAGYLAQQLVEPGRRALPVDQAVAHSQDRALKFDVRVYSYRSQALLTTARLYRGQTTNFRTQGSGFAPVLRLPAAQM